MVARLSTILAHLAVQIISVAASTATGTRPITQPTELAAPLYPGPRLDVPSGAHPSYSWPPAEATASPTCKTVQFAFPGGTNSDTSRADAVRDLYQRSWNQYAEYCFGHDQLLTLTNTCADDIFGWGATIVDGIDTAIVMNLTDIVTRQLAFIAEIDFRCVNLCPTAPAAVSEAYMR
jgi:mannosyl-oligosaccharide alpha-1,2-mannosidase